MSRTAVGVFALVGIALILLVLFGSTTPPTKPALDLPSQHSRTLRFGHNLTENSALHKAALLFAKKVNQNSNGQILIDIYPAQQLGNDHQMVEMARQGELDIILTPTAKMSIPVPAMQYADLPFFFPSREAVYEMLDGEPGDMLLKKLNDIELFGVTFWENGFKHFTGNQPFLSPRHFSDKKIRVMKSRMIMEQFQSFGAEPIAIDFHATRQALADGVVDGQENPLIAIYSMGFHEVQSDLVLSEHAYLGYVLSISQKTMNSLPFHHQGLLIKAAKEVTPIERQDTQGREQQLLSEIKKSGINIHSLTEKQRQQFASLTAHIPRRFEEVIGADIISKTEELLYSKYQSSLLQNDHLVIGINADLSGKAGLAIKRGVHLAIQEINNKGGLLGRPVHLIARDHKIIPSTGISNMEFFIGHPNVIAVIGGKHSAVVAGEMELVSKSQIPYLIPWAASKRLTQIHGKQSSLFRISANDLLASQYIADSALKKCKKPAIVVENTIWGRGNLESMRSYIASKSIAVSYEMTFNRGQDSYLPALKTLIDSQADCMILVANAHEGNIIIPELFDLNKELPIISHWGILGGDFARRNKNILGELDLTFFQTFLFKESDRPQAQELANKYRAEYGLAENEEIYSQHAVAQAYDLVQLLASAAQKANSSNRTAIIKALESSIFYDGVIKDYKPAFTQERHDGLSLSDFRMARFNSDGQIISAQ